MNKILEERKTIFISVFHSFVSKNILNTDALRLLCDSDRYRIVLLVSKLKKDFFEKHYSSPNVIVEEVDVNSIIENKHIKCFSRIGRLLIDTHYLGYKRREELERDPSVLGKIKYYLREFAVKLFGDKRIFKKIFQWSYERWTMMGFYNHLFEKYSPDLVFATDLFDPSDQALINESQHRNVRTVGMVRSWDNCHSKGLLPVIPNYAIVNNEVLGADLAARHDVRKEYIEVVGLPQFDSFINQKPISRAELCSWFGFDPNKKIVMFAPGGSILSDTDGDICDMLKKARKNGTLPKEVQFFIRNHPHHPADLSEFIGIEGVYVQSPGQELDKNNQKETELTPDDQTMLRNILAHTDVLIWVATSLCLDALVYDVPEVVVNFDGYQKKDYYHSVRRYHDEEHMKNMFTLRPFPIANNEKELINYISDYLKDRTKDKEVRALAREQQLYKVDGHSGERVARFLEVCIKDTI